MAITGFDISQLRSPIRERFSLALATAYARFVGAWHAMRNRRAVAQLLAWDAHMLKDIGLTQNDVRSAMSGPLLEDPSYRLSVLSIERRTASRRLVLAHSSRVVSLEAARRNRVRCLEI